MSLRRDPNSAQLPHYLRILLEKKLGIHIPIHEPDEPGAAPLALNNDAGLAAVALGPGSSLANSLRTGLNNPQENH